MKLSYRDKVIFIVAIVVLVLVAGFFLFIKPKYSEMNSAQTQLKAKQEERQKVEDKINTLPDLVKQLKDMASSVEEIQSHFLTEQDPYLHEQFIHEILDSSGVTVHSIKTDYTAAQSLTEYMVKNKNVNSYDLLIQADLYNELPQKVYDDYNKVKAEKGDSIIIGITSLSITYEDSFELTKVFNFIDTIAEDDKTMSVLSVGTADSEEAEENVTEGTISMYLYSILPLDIDKVMEETDVVEIVATEEATE